MLTLSHISSHLRYLPISMFSHISNPKPYFLICRHNIPPSPTPTPSWCAYQRFKQIPNLKLSSNLKVWFLMKIKHFYFEIWGVLVCIFFDGIDMSLGSQDSSMKFFDFRYVNIFFNESKLSAIVFFFFF